MAFALAIFSARIPDILAKWDKRQELINLQEKVERTYSLKPPHNSRPTHNGDPS